MPTQKRPKRRRHIPSCASLSQPLRPFVTPQVDDLIRQCFGASACVHEWLPSSPQRESPAPNPSHRPRGLAPASRGDPPSIDRDAPPSRMIDGPVAREPLLEHTGLTTEPPLTESTQSRFTAQNRERNREAERLLDRCETTESAIANARRAPQSAAFSHHANHCCDDWLTRSDCTPPFVRRFHRQRSSRRAVCPPNSRSM
jgi:hypothetical protein